MKKNYATNVITDLYSEADIDYIFLEELIGLVQYDQFDNVRLKTKNEIINGSLLLFEFLVANGFFLSDAKDPDFDYGASQTNSITVRHLAEKYIRSALSESSSDFKQYATVLRKRAIGMPPPEIPQTIISLLN